MRIDSLAVSKTPRIHTRHFLLSLAMWVHVGYSWYICVLTVYVCLCFSYYCINPNRQIKKLWQISDRYRSSASDQDVDDQTLLTFFDGFRSTSPTPPPFLSPWFNTVTMHMSRVSQARSVLGSSGTHVRGSSEFLDQIWFGVIFFFLFLSTSFFLISPVS